MFYIHAQYPGDVAVVEHKAELGRKPNNGGAGISLSDALWIIGARYKPVKLQTRVAVDDRLLMACRRKATIEGGSVE